MLVKSLANSAPVGEVNKISFFVLIPKNISFAILLQWSSVSPRNNLELRDQKINALNESIFLAKTALKYDKDNFFASAIIIGITFTAQGVSTGPDIFVFRNMLIDAKNLIQKYPDYLLSHHLYASILYFLCEYNGEKENCQESLDIVLEIFEKMKKNNFVFSHPTEGLIFYDLLYDIPRVYDKMGETEKGIAFIKKNKKIFFSI